MGFKNRTIIQRLRHRSSSRLGRLLVLSGARQTGKTTLATHAFGDYEYISLEDPVLRPHYTRLSAVEWIERHPRAVLDEVQKAPALVESVKAAYDRDGGVRYVLLGSSQILLLSKVRETLAGRVALETLWPLTLPEMLAEGWQTPVRRSRLLQWLEGDDGALLGMPAESPAYARAGVVFERYLRFGGMPVMHDPDLDDEERRRWLIDYRRTYLERDVGDLATLRDLEPFVRAQQVAGLRTAQLVNFSDLARAAGINAGTGRRFLRYLELSYQVLMTPPYFRNQQKRLAKMPKLHFLDPGVLRAVIGRWGAPTGELFESAVIAEVHKQLSNAGIEATRLHLRTHDGREVDLLLELEDGLVAIEVKSTARIAPKDARHLRGLAGLLDRPLLGALVISLDPEVRPLADGVLAVPAPWALGPADEPAR